MNENLKIKSLTIEQIQEIFFDAMINGWASGGEKKDLPDFCDGKEIIFTKDDFLVIDSYFINNETNKSAGMTMIFYQKIPVWTMSYHGFYNKRASRFLKFFLLKQYKTKVFIGGRGAMFDKNGTIIYHNCPLVNDFKSFFGREDLFEIVSFEKNNNSSNSLIDGNFQENAIHLGFHQYQGFCLL